MNTNLEILPHYIMIIFSDATSTHNCNTRYNTIWNLPTSGLLGSEKCVRYHLPRVIEETDLNVLENVNMHCHIGFCSYTRGVCIKLQIGMESEKLLYVSKFILSLFMLCSSCIPYRFPFLFVYLTVPADIKMSFQFTCCYALMICIFINQADNLNWYTHLICTFLWNILCSRWL